MKTYPLTVKQLIAANACHEQVKLFRKTFGASVNVTVARAIKVAKLFDFDFAAGALLSPQASAEYERVRAPARAKYERVRAATFARAYRGELK